MTMLSSDYFIFFKQKTAYEMRISDWSSDVCSSDLDRAIERGADHRALQHDDQSQMSRQRNTCRITNQPAECTGPRRSEEHTSELQSLMRISYAVFCLKKKKKNQTTIHQQTKKPTEKRQRKQQNKETTA